MDCLSGGLNLVRLTSFNSPSTCSTLYFLTGSCPHAGHFHVFGGLIKLHSLHLVALHSSLRFNLLFENRDEILKLFTDNDIFSSKHYFSLSQLLGHLPNKIWSFYSNHIINLFNDKRCTVPMAYKSVEIINKYGRALR